jgi:hypothetical protein
VLLSSSGSHALKIEAVHSSETANACQTARRSIQQDSNFRRFFDAAAARPCKTYSLAYLRVHLTVTSNATCFKLVSTNIFAYSSTLKMEATCSSETSVGFQRIMGRYIL